MCVTSLISRVSMKINHEFSLEQGLIASTRWLNLDHYQHKWLWGNIFKSLSQELNRQKKVLWIYKCSRSLINRHIYGWFFLWPVIFVKVVIIINSTKYQDISSQVIAVSASACHRWITEIHIDNREMVVGKKINVLINLSSKMLILLEILDMNLIEQP